MEQGKFLDIVDEQDQVIGQAEIEEAHNKHLLHRSVHTFIINSEGKLFVAQRSFRGKRYAGRWTIPGRHAPAGKAYEETAESMLVDTFGGISCELKMIGKHRAEDSVENEITAVYIGEADKVNLNKEVFETGKFLIVEEVRKLSTQKNATPYLGNALELYKKYKSENK